MSLLQYQNLQIPVFCGCIDWHDLGWQIKPYSGQEYFAEKKREEEKWKARERAGFG